jgi:tRNA modification GTPase
LVNLNKDTISAIATPPGKGGIGVVRVSGPLAADLSLQILGKLPAPRLATFTVFHDSEGEGIDHGLGIFFPSPHSFTGEDVLELQGHGGPVVMDLLLQRTLELGARIAEPGEFSLRAYLNDKIDLTQAEAIADLIDSSSKQAAKGAMNSLQGEFSKRIKVLDKKVVDLRLYIEAAIDFPEEEIDFLLDSRISASLEDILVSLKASLNQTRQGAVLNDGISLVLAGKPNAGKSSLMNALCGKDAAIVTDLAGTTRDVLSEHIQMDGIPINLFDTAGLRETDNPVEIEGMKRAIAEAERADIVLLLVDVSKGGLTWQEEVNQLLSLIERPSSVLIALNKIDLLDHEIPSEQSSLFENSDRAVIQISAKTGVGISELKTKIKQIVGYVDNSEGVVLARRRHIHALERAEMAVIQGKEQLETQMAGELLAEDLKIAHESLCEITGEFSSDDLLGEIFSSFCIGK